MINPEFSSPNWYQELQDAYNGVDAVEEAIDDPAVIGDDLPICQPKVSLYMHFTWENGSESEGLM